MRRALCSVLTLIVAAPLLAGAQQAGSAAPLRPPVFRDPSQPLAVRVDDLVQRMTLAEKISLLGTTAPAVERLGIPPMNGWNQSLHGIVWTRPTTMFPVPIAMAATWNPELVRIVAGAIADEGRAVNNYWPTVPGKREPTGGRGQMVTVTAAGERLRHNGLVYRSPVINIGRDPRWGRIWEAFGEDPWLTSRMTVACVRGTQGDDPKSLKLAATLKHYAVNNEERDRQKIDVTVSERILREYFLPHFRAGIVEGGAQSIMSCYDSVNGTPCAENEWLLKTVLRGEWGFEGFIVPDSGAVKLLVTGHRKYATVEEAAAKKADAAVLFVGINELVEREAIDRFNLNLPAAQLELVRRVLQANPKTVVVLQNGGPVSLASAFGGTAQQPIEPQAVLGMFWAGEEGGTAIADVLFGDCNPAGRLPYTVYRSAADVPPMKEYDITKGFTYMYFAGEPNFAFGHGLSYTTFGYANLRISGNTPGGPLDVQVDVRNDGERAGDEVAQLYVRDVEASVKRPSKQLVGFERIALQPGQTRTVSFSVPAERLAFFDEKRQAWVLEPGAFDVMVGSSSADIRLRGQLQIAAAGQWEPGSR